jgi:hypothetical protein
MDLPYCKICGERHRLGHCPEYDEPPARPQKPAAVEKNANIDPEPETKGAGIVAQDPWREAWNQARCLTPEDMKQESMPDLKPRFDRNAYQRELMRKRRWKAVDADA